MNKPTRSFRPSDFSWRDFPYFIAAFLILSVISVGFGLLLETLPEFWAGMIAGSSVALTFLYVAFVRKKRREEGPS